MEFNEAYYEAEALISDALLAKATKLSLGFLSLVQLPTSLQSLTKLEALILFRTELTTLPEWIGSFTQLKSLVISSNQLSRLPESFGNLTQLEELDISDNQLTTLPESIGNLFHLRSLYLSSNQLTTLPESIGNLTHLRLLDIEENQLTALPEQLSNLKQLQELRLINNHLTDLPASLNQYKYLAELDVQNNPLNPELSVAYEQGIEAVRAYLRAKAAAQITLNEAKLILVGEGEVGKSSLLGALRGDTWVEGLPTTHGIEIKQVQVINKNNGVEITLNGWDFGGQPVYRPTHQLFFSAPAVYLVVWKPREGPQQGFVREWIQLIKHREPDAKILVVATHGGPKQRQPDINRQELRDLFGDDTVLDFFHIDSKPNDKDQRRGIEELKQAIAQVASNLPEVGRSVPKRWQDVRLALADTKQAYLLLENVFDICQKHEMDEEEAQLFITISHRLGHLIHYEHDPALRDIVVLKPDWLATAISFVLDDEETRKASGLVPFSRLSALWDDPSRPITDRYPPHLHPLFLRLMERYDLSYKVTLPTEASDFINFWHEAKRIIDTAVNLREVVNHLRYTSLIAQLVPDTRPEKYLRIKWLSAGDLGDAKQIQICRIVDENGQSASAEGLFYQLIVRLHRYSLGRDNFYNSVHWQRGLLLDDDYNGRALLEHIGNDIRITVRAPYPERFLAMLTEEIKYLVESFWEGLHCDVMVPCIDPCGNNSPGVGLYEVEKLIESKRRKRLEYPCAVCNEWQNIDSLLHNAPSAQPVSAKELFAEFTDIKQELAKVIHKISDHSTKTMGRFDRLDNSTRRILSRLDRVYSSLMKALIDEAKEGPRLFTLKPVRLKQNRINPKEWISAQFQLTLWCEHSRLPLPALNGLDSTEGVYDIDVTFEWFVKAARLLGLLNSALSLILPVAASGIKLTLDEATYKDIQNQLEFNKNFINASASGSEKFSSWLAEGANISLEPGDEIYAEGAVLREFHSLLKSLDTTSRYGGLVRVMNKRQEFLWVHPQFVEEY